MSAGRNRVGVKKAALHKRVKQQKKEADGGTGVAAFCSQFGRNACLSIADGSNPLVGAFDQRYTVRLAILNGNTVWT